MVRILSLAAMVLAIALGAQAAHNCQCLFSDGSHCCATSSAYGPGESCQTVCNGAVRSSDQKACSAGGKWSSVSGWNSQFRAGCNR
ncbi:hypothetical protein EJ02DRAFT_439560 [Clathrospora elynae]|uniref:Extracellular membrane protein CFEM domain-containing protein n=1 Tax=Clathrospora elynae TaxID=706981 RepID=A0A6A5S2L8_9PLEO|nr:hypothetical protein EJ02DRAFT_439560 [Clathrospora elynae]